MNKTYTQQIEGKSFGFYLLELEFPQQQQQ